MMETVFYTFETVFDVLAIPAILLALAIALDAVVFTKGKKKALLSLIALAVLGFIGGWLIDGASHNGLHFYEIGGALIGIVIFDFIFYRFKPGKKKKKHHQDPQASE